MNKNRQKWTLPGNGHNMTKIDRNGHYEVMDII